MDRLRSENRAFSGTALSELRIAFDSIYEILDLTSRAYKARSAAIAKQVEPLEEVIDDLVEDLNARHVYRMVNGYCDPINGIRYQTILTNVEHISDKCSDIAIYIMEGENASIFGNEHSFVHQLHHSSTDEYMQNYNDDHSKYFEALNAIPVVEPRAESESKGEAEPKAEKAQEKKSRIKKKEPKKDAKKEADKETSSK